MFSSQVKTIIKKNMIVSYRSREIFIESAIPLIIAVMLSLKAQLGILNSITPIMWALSVSGTSRSIMIQLVEEKSKRYKETQKIMGLSNTAYNLGWFLTAYIRMGMTVTVFILSQIMFNKLFGFDWEQNYTCSFGMLSLEFIIYAFTAINQSFFFASIFSESKIAGEVSTFITVAMTFFVFMVYMPAAAQSVTFYIIISLVSPQCNCAFAFVSSLESIVNNPGVVNFFPMSTIVSTYNLSDATIQLSVSFFAYLLLFLYCDQVVPNEYGVSKNPLFFMDFIKVKQMKPFERLLEDQTYEDTSSALYHEVTELSQIPSIKIKNLQKLYGNLKVVDNLTLNLYESQIFCLLGHNGAGKTTTLSLLTGMVKKSGGNVISNKKIQCKVNGLSLDNDLIQIRNSLGLCTQKDCLYDTLTVQEHLEFIGGIKGAIIQLEIDQLLNKTDLTKERNSLVSSLSGGSKRKLSLAMALIGNSKVVFLDEPTSGMDAYSRRAIWDILERIKKEKRTIILTTHHLDEAEILADSIGIMSRGQLLAVGSSEFIKKKFGEGYNLKLRCPQHTRQIVEQIVKDMIPLNTVIADQTTNDQLSFLIPFKSQDLLQSLFKALENIPSIEIQMQINTLEDAFINIGQEEEKLLSKQEEQTSTTQEHYEDLELKTHSSQTSRNSSQVQTPSCLTRPPQYQFSNQLFALFSRRFYTTIRTNTNYVALLIPILTLSLGLMVVNYMSFPSGPYSVPQVQDYVREVLLALVCVIGFSFNSTVYISLPVLETELQLKFIFINNNRTVLHGIGLRVLPYWLGTFIFDWMVYATLIFFYFVVAFAMHLTCVTSYFWETLFVLMCFSVSYIPFAYVCSFVFKTTERALKLFAIFNFFVMFDIPILILAVLNFLRKSSENPQFFEYAMYSFEMVFIFFSPFYAFVEAYALMQGKQRYDYVASFLAPGPIISERYWVYCLALIFQGIEFSAIIYYLELKSSSQRAKNQQNNRDYLVEGLGQDVTQEYSRVLNNNCDDSLKSVLLQKQYYKNGPEILQKTTFGVKTGEIFGIIGPNGAGKSTLLNIFSGLVKPSAGEAQILNSDVNNRNMEVAQHVGICPQFDSIWENLTPVEHLRLFGRIKGLVGDDLEQAKDYFIQTMQLNLYEKTQAGRLSGGNKRKLCVADALIGGSDITFFDEPSTGVDPISRRFLFNTLKRNVQLRNCSVIMTTHTIEEAESLSDKIGILIVGQFKCIGSPEYLRKFYIIFIIRTYGSGYQIDLKLKGTVKFEEILNELTKIFPSAQQMEDKRAQFMTFSVSDQGFSFYKAFQFFDHKKQIGIIEEFSIKQRQKFILSRSSLESVFMHFSKIQMEQNKQLGLCMD